MLQPGRFLQIFSKPLADLKPGDFALLKVRVERIDGERVIVHLQTALHGVDRRFAGAGTTEAVYPEQLVVF